MQKLYDMPSLDWKSLLVLACCISLVFPSCAGSPGPKKPDYQLSQLVVYDDYYDGYIGTMNSSLDKRYRYIIRDEFGSKAKTLDEAQRYHLKYYTGSKSRGVINLTLAAANVIIFPIYIAKAFSSSGKKGNYKKGLRYLEEGRNGEAIEAFNKALKVETKKSKREARRIQKEKRIREAQKKARRITEEQAREAPPSVNPDAIWLRNGTDIHFRLGQAHDRAGDASSALEHYSIFLDYSTGVNRFKYTSNPRPSGSLPELFAIAKNRIKALEPLEKQDSEFPIP